MLYNEKINKVLSPITKSDNTKFIKYISAEKIIKCNFELFQIDVSSFFYNLTNISLYKCLDTGYLFYYPFHIKGDSKYYELLQNIEWYYQNQKWEYNIALKLIKPDSEVLEIGCANGSFMEKLQKNGIKVSGLEINQSVLEKAQQNGLNILNEPLNIHAEKNKQKYDVVCSFQVMEHLSDVNDVIYNSLQVLKKNGMLIISVPNNDSYLKKDFNILNLPPHHMGLWNERSIKSLEAVFSMNLQDIYFEPMNKPNIYFDYVLTNFFYKKYKIPVFLTRKIIPLFLPVFNKKFLAFTMLAYFNKK
jgi:2-polyprenyl-3-methyl-5-hydroxy-6-metoxy-1,4-benzoquinol methylase